MGKPHKYADSRLTASSALAPERLLALAVGAAAQVRGGLLEGQQPLVLLTQDTATCVFAVRTGLIKTDQLTFRVAASQDGPGSSGLRTQILQYRTVQQTVNLIPVSTKQMVGLPLYLRFCEQLGLAVVREDPTAEVHLSKGPREIALARTVAAGTGAVATGAGQAPTPASSPAGPPQPGVAGRGLCPGCAEPVDPQDLFCGECGSALGATGGAQERSARLPGRAVPDPPVADPAPAVFRVGEPPRPPQPSRPPEPRARLVLDDGTELVVERAVVVGRDPAPTSAAPGAVLLPVADPGHSLSKTHAALVVDGPGAWVIDLHSSNGTVLRVGARRLPCPAGERVAVPDGAALELGARSATVHLERHR